MLVLVVGVADDAVGLQVGRFVSSDEAIRRLPIVDDGGTLTGIITLDDLLVVSAAELSNASDVIEQQAGPI